jgi:hypothetical protein
VFLLNVGSKWTLASEMDEVRGAVFLASGNSHARFTRRTGPELGRVLIDPQLYLSGLDVKGCSKICGRLATHPWFCVEDVPEFDSSMGVNDWQKIVNTAAVENWTGKAPEGDQIDEACTAAIECQLRFGCTQVILPVPLLDEREDAGGLLGTWLDAGISIAEDMQVGQPRLATIAVSYPTLNEEAFEDGGFLDAIVDQVTARDGLSGVYIVVGLTGTPDHPFETPAPALKAYLHLSKAFRDAKCSTVMVNFADVFGFVCVGVGATDVVTGESQTRRRLCLNAFRNQGGGLAVPHFYSHRALAEFASETDLDKLSHARTARRVLDETPYSEDLVEAIVDGGSAADVPAWAESQNNLGAAQRHFIARLAAECERLQLMSRKKRAAAIQDMLDEAQATELLIRRKLEKKRLDGHVGRFAPAAAWRELSDEF